jgi:hypothetical protein
MTVMERSPRDVLAKIIKEIVECEIPFPFASNESGDSIIDDH